MGETTLPITGGCLCGAVRYEADEPPTTCTYCHCRMCQKAYGNPFGTFAIFRQEAFRVTRGEPKFYKSSETAERGFCADCGSPLIMRVFDSQTLGLMVGSLDHPEDAQPKKHMGIESQIPWLTIDDALPRKTTKEHIGYEVET